MILVYAQMCTELHKDERKNKKTTKKQKELSKVILKALHKEKRQAHNYILNYFHFRRNSK